MITAFWSRHTLMVVLRFWLIRKVPNINSRKQLADKRMLLENPLTFSLVFLFAEFLPTVPNRRPDHRFVAWHAWHCQRSFWIFLQFDQQGGCFWELSIGLKLYIDEVAPVEVSPADRVTNAILSSFPAIAVDCRSAIQFGKDVSDQWNRLCNNKFFVFPGCSCGSNGKKSTAMTPKNRKYGDQQIPLPNIYLALKNTVKKWTMPIRDWKSALNQFSIIFWDRLPKYW